MNESYAKTRDSLELYFDQTAVKAWEILTTDLPVSGVRARVRAGRDRIRRVLLDSLPMDLHGMRILDAGCGTGQTTVELAKRGANVVGIDLSSNLIELARARLPDELSHRVEFRVGDMLSNQHGKFDHVVAMDSLIHYNAKDISAVVNNLAKQTKTSVSFTVAPKTIALRCLLAIGRLFPKTSRSPNVIPVNVNELKLCLSKIESLKSKELKVLERVKVSFYVSEAVILKL